MWRSILRDPGADNHLVQFYDDPTFLQGAVSRWLAPSLLAGGGGIVLSSPDHWRMARMSLRDHGLNPHRLEAAGRLIVIDAYDFLSAFMADGKPRDAVFHAMIGDAVRRLRGANPDAEIRAWGEGMDILRRNHNLLAAQFLEALWDEAIAEHDLRLLCSYNVDFLDPAGEAKLHEMAARHSAVIPSTDYAAFNEAVAQGLGETLGADAASALLAYFWDRPAEVRMPVGERVLMYVEANHPLLAPKLHATAHRHYTPAAFGMERPPSAPIDRLTHP